MPALVPPPTAETVGRRVTIRYRVGEMATDVVGHVEDIDPRIRVRRRDGSLVDVDPHDIVIWKVVPEPSTRRRSRR